MINEGQPTEETKEFLKQQGFRIKKARLEPKYGKQIALTGGYEMLEYFGLVRKYFQAKYEIRQVSPRQAAAFRLGASVRPAVCVQPAPNERH